MIRSVRNGVMIQTRELSTNATFSYASQHWPLWAKALRQMATPQDKGIGDVVARLIGDENGESFRKWFRATFNRECNCKGRQAHWNRIYPLEGDPK